MHGHRAWAAARVVPVGERPLTARLLDRDRLAGPALDAARDLLGAVLEWTVHTGLSRSG